MSNQKEKQPVRPKNITFASVKRTAKEANKLENYDLSDTERIRFYPIFPEGKIKELTEELTLVITQAGDEGIELNDDQFQNHVLFLCIKHFTHLKKELANDYQTQVLQMEQLVDAGIFRIIVDDIFMPKELQKVMNYIGDHIGTTDFISMISDSAESKMEELRIRHQEIEDTLDEINKGKQEKTVE